MSVFDGIRAGLIADRSQFYKDVSAAPFYGANKPAAFDLGEPERYRADVSNAKVVVLVAGLPKQRSYL